MQLSLTLKNGRKLAYAEYGFKSAERAVIFHHGLPGSRIDGLLAAQYCAKQQVRLLCFDRPGFGDSPGYEGRTLLDWGNDLTEAIDLLNIKDLYLVGVSGGAPAAMAAAYSLQTRVRRVALVSPFAPFRGAASIQALNKVNSLLLRGLVNKNLIAIWGLTAITKLFILFPSSFLLWLKLLCPKRDKRILMNRRVAAVLQSTVALSLKQGVTSTADELRILLSPWGFNPSAITTGIDLWHGEDDTYVPMRAVEELRDVLPSCTSFFMPGKGHFFGVRYISKILDKLLV